MRYSIKHFLLISIAVAVVIGSCKKDTYEDYPGGVPYNVISILDVRPIYKGTDVILTKENMYGGEKLNAVVISDHAAGNLPKGLLVVQDMRRVQTLRGISLELGDAAANYHPGDSVVIMVAGKTLTRKNGILTITGITEADITKAGKGTVNINAISTTQLQANYNDYESSLCILNKSSFNPAPKPGETISGAKVINDGFGNLVLYTNPGVSYANNAPYGLAAYVGIPFGTPDSSVQLITRNGGDIINMGSSAQDLLITGTQTDPKGGDGSYEYVQLMATKDIDFVTTPYSIIFCNNAGTASSATPLDAGWATGGQRTIKWDITTGSVKKGKFFYFTFQGKKINGSAGTYSFPPGTDSVQKFFFTSGNNPITGGVNLPNLGDGGLVRPSEFGTSGPWANSGNTCGVAIFKGTTVTETSVPEDVLFLATGGGAAVYNPTKTPILGYRICNNDWYSMYSVSIDSNTYKPVIVPYFHYQSLGNFTSMAYPFNDLHPPSSTASDAGLYSMMGGTYNITLGRWTTARKQVIVELFQGTATIDSLEKHSSITKLVE